MWRSHLDKFSYSEEENQHLGDAIEAAGGEVLLDQRVRFGGSHHQKLVVLRHPGAPERDVAFAGGIDLCHSRRDDAEHRGDPQAVRMARQYGERPAVARRSVADPGPVVGALGHHVPGALDRPRIAGHALADRMDRRQAAPGRSERRCAAAPAARPAAVRSAGRAGVADLSRRPFRVRVRAARRAQRRARLHQGGAAGQAPDLSGGPVPVVQTGRTPVRRRADAPTRTCT